MKDPASALWWREPRGSFTTERIGRLEVSSVERPTEHCLTEFLHLTDASDEQIKEFAGRWGILGLWPIRRECCLLWQKVEFASSGTVTDEDCVWLAEPTALWRGIAKYFRTLLLIRAGLWQSEQYKRAGLKEADWKRALPKAALWEVVTRLPPDFNWDKQRDREETRNRVEHGKQFDSKDFMDALEAQRKALYTLVSRWTRIAPVRLIMEAGQNGSPTVRLDIREAGEDWTAAAYQLAEESCYGSEIRDFKVQGRNLPEPRQSLLLTTLVVQIVAALSGPIYLCSVCGNPYEPKRKPRGDQLNFCDDPACKGKGGNIRSNRSHAKKREKK